MLLRHNLITLEKDVVTYLPSSRISLRDGPEKEGVIMDLPIDLIPEILKFVFNPAHLASACLVNKPFYDFALPLLYQRIAVFSWYKDAKTRVVQLFVTLSRNARIALFVQSLEIRDFPKHVSDPDSSVSVVISALKNCTNLRRFVWTRDGTLNSAILETLSSCATPRELEINGRNESNYDEALLLKFTKLKSLSIIIPSLNVVTLLPTWMGLNSDSLTSLTLIGRASTMMTVTNADLTSLKPALSNLEHFHISCFYRVSDIGVWSILSASVRGLISLGLEGLSPDFDYQTLSNAAYKSHSANPLRRLRSITASAGLSYVEFTAGLLDLLECSPLEEFQIHATYRHPGNDPGLLIILLDQIVERHAKTLRRFAVNRIVVDHKIIKDVCEKCPNLEELFVCVDPLDSSRTLSLANCFSHSKTLRSIHINDSFTSENYQSREFMPTLALLKNFNSGVMQFGYNSNIWQVKRNVVCKDGSLKVQLSLGPYEFPNVPEQFLVLQT